MARKKLAKKKDGASKDEVASEPISELPSDERRYADVVELELVDFIDDYENDEYEGKFESTPSKNRRGEI